MKDNEFIKNVAIMVLSLNLLFACLELIKEPMFGLSWSLGAAGLSIYVVGNYFLLKDLKGPVVAFLRRHRK